jgi:hypothetical protein
MKSKILILLFLCSLQLFAQEKLYTKSGTIIFESSVPSFEEVKATNTKVTAILKSDGTIASLALVKGFRFKIALMEEHFNENYIESSKFPKATFSGKIIDYSFDKLTTAKQNFLIKGKLTIRGKSKEFTIKSQLQKDAQTIVLEAEFIAKPEDFDIQIPKIVRSKVAKEVVVSLFFEFKEK